MAGERPRWRLLSLAACCVLAAVPFLSVQFAPITDLPQHLAQIRLLHETIADPDGPYRIQWLTPYLLAYLPLTLAWQLSQSEAAGRPAMLILALLWTLAIHALAFKRERPSPPRSSRPRCSTTIQPIGVSTASPSGCPYSCSGFC